MAAWINRPKKKREHIGKRKERSEIYNTKRWRRLREAHISHFPLCQVCEMQGRIRAVEDVHHLLSYLNYEGQMRKQMAYDPCNIISVCRECHNRLHNGDLRGCESLDEIQKRLDNLNLNRKDK